MRSRSFSELIGTADEAWFAPAIERLRSLPRSDDARLAGFLAGEGPVLISRAPGRLDVMGGIADYSGSLVLEMPLARATYCLLQARDDDRIELASLRDDGVHFTAATLPSLLAGDLSSPPALAARLRAEGAGWAAYVLGVVQLCARIAADQGGARLQGMSLLVMSDVPEGKGVSSSAALEVAAMASALAHFGVALEGAEVAAACQWVENHVVGAPCGIMDQLTSVCGRQGRLLRLRCQPALVEGHLAVPPGYRFFGIDSGERHAVTGHDYAAVRTAAFMGYRMIADAAGLRVSSAGEHAVVEDPRWGGYLANLSPAELDERFLAILPERMWGREFLERFGGHTDTVTRVDPEVAYPVRQAAAHPVWENARVERFGALLERLGEVPGGAEEMGRLMYESHASYGACGLGSRGTDRLVEMVRRAGPAAGLYGAKITGGGSGGTVAVFGRAEAEEAVRAIAQAYGGAEVFAESGPGAEEMGVVIASPT